MQIRFKQAVAIDGHKFPLGIHEVPEALLEHPYMVKLLKCGYATKTDVKSMKTPQQIQAEELEATKKLTDRLDGARLKKEKLAAKNKEADELAAKEKEQAQIEGELKEEKKNKNKR